MPSAKSAAGIGAGVLAATVAVLSAVAPLFGTYYVSPAGSANALGGALTPWSMAGANARAPANAVIRLSPGTYTTAPNRERVLFAAIGNYARDTSLISRTIIDAPLVFRGKKMRVQGVWARRGIDFEATSDSCLGAWLRVNDHVWYGGGTSSAAHGNSLMHTDVYVRSFGGHCYGEDPNRGQRPPRVNDNTVALSRVIVVRNQGEERVMSRWGGVDRMHFSRAHLRFFQNDPSNTNADDFASFKSLSCMFWTFDDSCLVEFDDLNPNRNGSGAFFMVRDSSVSWRSQGTTWRTLRGKIWLSFNTAGGIYKCGSCPGAMTCTCKDHKFIGDTFDVVGLGAQCGSKTFSFIGCKFPRPFDTSGALALAGPPL